MEPQYLPDDEINLLDYWRVLVKRKKLLFAIVFLAAIASIVTSLMLPKMYASTTSLLPPQNAASGAGLISSKLPGGLSGLAGNALGMTSPIDLWVGILKSRTIQDEIVSAFQLKAVYRTESEEAARRQLDDAVQIKKSKEEILSITVEDRDPQRAADIANALSEALDRFNRGITTTSGGRMRAFVENRLADAKIALAQSEEALKAFQEKNRAIKLDDQSAAIIGAIGEVKGTLIAKEVELQTLLSFATPENPQVKTLKTEVKELRKMLQSLAAGGDHEGEESRNIFIPTDRLPDLSLQYVRLLRDAKIHETLFELLTEQFEMARIQEAKDSPTVQILDMAVPSETRVRPKRAQIVILSTFTAGFFGIFLVFFLEYLNKAKAMEMASASKA